MGSWLVMHVKGKSESMALSTVPTFADECCSCAPIVAVCSKLVWSIYKIPWTMYSISDWLNNA